jgi:enamine deaminase RidA (YjgF/YER057c/UK114 family)
MTTNFSGAADSKAPVAVIPPNVPFPKAPYTPAIKAGGWVFVAGQLATDFKNGLAPEVIPANKDLDSQLGREGRYIFKNLAATVAAGGCDLDKDAVRIWQWFASQYPTAEEFAAGTGLPRISVDPYHEARDEFLSEPRPASTGMAIRQLAIGGAELEIDVICIADGGKSIGFGVPEGLPAPLAGYSPAIRRGDWVFLAGELPVDWCGDFLSPVHLGEPSALAKEARHNPYYWFGSPIEKQTDYVLQKLSKIAEAGGSSLSRAVKADVYLANPADYAGMDRVWKRWFPKNPPARCVIPYVGLGSMGSRIEIALVLLANDSKLTIDTIEASDAPQPFSHEPQAVKAGNFLFFSQQMAYESSGKLAPGMIRVPEYPWYGSPARAQMRYMMKNVAAICEKAGSKLEYVVRRACFHPDMQWFQESIDEWAAHFPGLKPASTTLKIAGPLVIPGANTLLDLIAYVP